MSKVEVLILRYLQVGVCGGGGGWVNIYFVGLGLCASLEHDTKCYVGITATLEIVQIVVTYLSSWQKSEFITIFAVCRSLFQNQFCNPCISELCFYETSLISTSLSIATDIATSQNGFVVCFGSLTQRCWPGGGGTLVKHVVIRKHKNAGKGIFFMHCHGPHLE